MFRSIVLLVGGLASLSTVSLFAQDAVLGQEYGSGVHAYFTGDSMKAFERLTSVIERGSKDPRAFYFRGLAYLKLGRAQDAVADFRKGAELESKDINRFYNVGKSLERVQGSARIELETYRVNARMAAFEENEKLRKARYEAIQREEDRVLREQATAAPEVPIDVPEAAASNSSSSSDPFAVPETEKTGKKPAAPVTVATPATPAKTPVAKPAEKPAEPPAAGDDPFAEPSQKPVAKNPEKKGGSIFGAIGKAAGKAVGNAVGTKPAAEMAPAAKAPADNNDPFGQSLDEKAPAAPIEKAEKKAAPIEKKAEPAEPADPFGP